LEDYSFEDDFDDIDLDDDWKIFPLKPLINRYSKQTM
jgi:hypothetical protein